MLYVQVLYYSRNMGKRVTLSTCKLIIIIIITQVVYKINLYYILSPIWLNGTEINISIIS